MGEYLLSYYYYYVLRSMNYVVAKLAFEVSFSDSCYYQGYSLFRRGKVHNLW